ncbi:MAG: peptidase M16 [Desulfobacteraceae bacterium 4572_35.1]|nr:MAG: peptidase M16 [Desulfobacteraceae bacterium 4572_35.1]
MNIEITANKYWHVLVFTLLICCVLLQPVFAATPPTLQVKQFKLENGLTLLVKERHDSPTFSAYMTIGVGSVNEVGDNRGIAHLLEHMRFKGTKTVGTRDYAAEKKLIEQIDVIAEQLRRARIDCCVDNEKIDKLRQQMIKLQQQERKLVVKDEISSIYARHGGVGFNAFTGKDLTSYKISLPSNKLELWMALEADRMQNAVLREFYTERDVVMEERRRSYESKPSGMMYEALLATAFRVHPYRHPVIGWTSDINNLTKKKTADFLHRYYAPINTVIAIVGDVETDKVKQLVSNYFGKIYAGEKIPPVTAVEPKQQGERRCEVRYDARPQVLVAYHKPTLPTRDDYAFDLISYMLTEGATSRLYKSLVLEQQLATAVSSYSAPGGHYDNLYVFSLIPRYPHSAAEVERALYVQLAELTKHLVTAAELENICKRLRVDRLHYLRTNDGLANMLTRFQVIAGGWEYLRDYDQQVAKITPKDIQQVAQRWLNADNRTVITLVQEKN